MSMKRILVVDDEIHMRKVIELKLLNAGYDVRTAPDGFQALKELEKRSADLVLCDIRMPEMDGMQLLSKIKESDPSIAVVMITGYGSIESAVGAIKAGADD